MSKLIRPSHYQALLGMRQTEQGIKLIKDFFQQNLSTELRMPRWCTRSLNGKDSLWQNMR